MTFQEKLIIPVILAGGRGTRLWPLSRASRPKQFLAIAGKHSLFQQTLERIGLLPDHYSSPVIVTNNDYRFQIAEQAREIGIKPHSIILEAIARNTAFAITSACIAIAKNNDQAIVHIMPSDHKIIPGPGYLHAMSEAKNAAMAGWLVTFGIAPNEPSSRFGYIKSQQQISNGIMPVEEFIEKPELEQARAMIDSGDYMWNSGMFMFRVSSFLDECQALAPEIFAASKTAVEMGQDDLDFFRLHEPEGLDCPDASVDFAIFEKTNRASLVPFEAQWHDMGSWKEIWKAGTKDSGQNFMQGPVFATDAKNSLIISDSMHIEADRVNDMAIIASEDAIYIGPLHDSSNITHIMRRLNSSHHTSQLTRTHKTSYRPWGGFSLISKGANYQVKQIFVMPGKRLSLQKHHHRSEHWVVIKGTATATLEEKIVKLNENESIYIPPGKVHRLANECEQMLELIEIQTGSYLGEDDIIRLNDEFGRI